MDELTDAQRNELAERLRGLEAELAEVLERGKEGARAVELDQASVGRLSRVDAMQQQQMAVAARRNQQIRLQRTRAALHALEQGEYGYCRRCEEPIGYRRLSAMPEAPFCIECG